MRKEHACTVCTIQNQKQTTHSARYNIIVMCMIIHSVYMHNSCFLVYLTVTWATRLVYLGVDGHISALGEARILVKGPHLLQSIQVPILEVLHAVEAHFQPKCMLALDSECMLDQRCKCLVPKTACLTAWREQPSNFATQEDLKACSFLAQGMERCK